MNANDHFHDASGLRLPQVRRRRLSTIVTRGLLSVAIFAAWASLIAWNWRRIEGMCGPQRTAISSAQEVPAWEEWQWKKCGPILMAADTIEYYYYYWGFPRSVGSLLAAERKTLFVESNKRPLYGPVSASLNVLVMQLLGLKFPLSMFVVLAFYAATCTHLMYFVMRALGGSTAMSAMFTGMASLSSAWITVFSMPESYSLSVAALLACLLSGVRLQQAKEDDRHRKFLRHVALSGIAAWVYLPICGAILMALRDFRSVQGWRTVLVGGAVVLGIAVLPQFVLADGGTSALKSQIEYGVQWGALGNLVHVATWTNVVSAIAFFGFVGPSPDFLRSTGDIRWPEVARLPIALIGVAIVGASYIALIAARRGTRHHGGHLGGAAVWLACLVMFHVFFNPAEILLYLSVPLTLVIFLMASIAVRLEERWTHRITLLLLGVLVVELASWGEFCMRVTGLL